MEYSLLSALCTISHQRTADPVLQSMYSTNLFIFRFLSVNERLLCPSHISPPIHTLLYYIGTYTLWRTFVYTIHNPYTVSRCYNGSHMGFFSFIYLLLFFYIQLRKVGEMMRVQKRPCVRRDHYCVRSVSNKNVIIVKIIDWINRVETHCI